MFEATLKKPTEDQASSTFDGAEVEKETVQQFMPWWKVGSAPKHGLFDRRTKKNKLS